nr:hypothetical protein [Rhodococcus pyridinivorans]
MEPQPVVPDPLVEHFRVDDHPPLGERPALVPDAELGPGRARTSVGGNHIGRAHPPKGVRAQIGEHQFGTPCVLQHPQTFVFEQNLHIGEPVDSPAEHLLECRLIDELLGMMTGSMRCGGEFDDRVPGSIDKGDLPAGKHVLGQSVCEADLLPDPQDFLVGGDRPRPGVDIRVAFDDHDLQAGSA